MHWFTLIYNCLFMHNYKDIIWNLCVYDIYIYDMIFVSVRHIPLRSGKWQTPKKDSWWSRDQIEQLHSRGVSFAIQDLRIRTPTLVLFQFPRRSPNFSEVFLGLRLLGVWSSHSKKQILSWSTNPFHKFRCFRCSSGSYPSARDLKLKNIWAPQFWCLQDCIATFPF